MAAASAVWDRNECTRPEETEEKLFLFGYSCKIFRDNEKAAYIDKGKHLIPWMGDDTLMIDRYDVRGYLHDLRPYEPDPNAQYEDPSSEEEKLCDEERYLALRADLTEEQLYQEEELKRLRAAVASDGAYHEIGFTYDNETYQEPSTAAKVEDPDDDLYEKPEGLEVPNGMEVPYNMKIHAIIEKTALFVSQQGGQMEIIIKMKQQANPQFAFMHLENPLYPYYKHLVKEIKAARYKPVQIKKEVVSSDDEDDEHYLHPSLMSGKAEDVPKFTVPSINFRRTDNDSYSVLVRNLQQQIIEDAYSNSPKEFYGEPTFYENTSLDQSQSGTSFLSSDGDNDDNLLSQIVVPPPDLQPVIDKMAEYVGKNGEDFETVVKSKNDKRFDFLNPGTEYYSYYIRKRNESRPVLVPPKIKKKKKVKKLVPTCPPIEIYDVKREPEISTCEAPTSDVFSTQDSNSQHAMSAEHSPVPEQKSEALFTQESVKEIDVSEASAAEDHNTKHSHKALKGPISFSLKVKDSDGTSSDKPKKALLLDDSEEENVEQNPAEKTDSSKSRKVPNESRTTIVSRNCPAESEEKTAKSAAEISEQKLAEEKIKERLLAAAREKLAVQKKEKQLQLERKRKAALFLKMLEKKKKKTEQENERKREDSSSPSVSQKIDIPGCGFSPDRKNADPEFFSSVKIPGLDFSPFASNVTTPKNGDLPHNEANHVSSLSRSPSQNSKVRNSWSSPSDVSSDEEAYSASRIQSTISSNSNDSRHRSKEAKKEHKSSRKKSLPAKYSRRSPSPSALRNHKPSHSRKEKALPAAYAYVRRSRSRSRSPPRRHRPDAGFPGPKRWIRRRM